MIAKNDHKFYIQHCDYYGIGIDGTKKDLEEDFDGLRYIKLTGYEGTGKVKNTYQESYADADHPRLYMPSSPALETTTLTLTLCFFGDDRYIVHRTDIHRVAHRYFKEIRILLIKLKRDQHILSKNRLFDQSGDLFRNSDRR